jgi:hypothetical protein
VRFTLTVELEGRDPFDTLVTGRDVREYEARYDTSWLAETTSVTAMTKLAHIAAVRHGQFTGDWAAFDAACEGVQAADGDDAARPTPTSPTAGPS